MTSEFLLDTSIISVVAPGRPEFATNVGTFIKSNAGLNHLSVVSVLEIQQGVSSLRRKGGVERAANLGLWLQTLLSVYANRVINIDAEIALEAGKLSDFASSRGINPGYAEILIAATAKIKNLQLLTRNMRHFGPLGIRCSDPFESQL